MEVGVEVGVKVRDGVNVKEGVGLLVRLGVGE